MTQEKATEIMILKEIIMITRSKTLMRYAPAPAPTYPGGPIGISVNEPVTVTESIWTDFEINEFKEKIKQLINE